MYGADGRTECSTL